MRLRLRPLSLSGLAAASLSAPLLGADVDVAQTGWRFAPVSWQTDHRSQLDGTYGSTAHAAYVAGPSDYLYFTHDDGSGTYVGHDPGLSVPALAGLTGHVVPLPAGNNTAPEVAALAAPVLEQFDGVTAVVDNEDGTVTISGLSDGDLTTGTTFADRSGGGVMGVSVTEILASDGGTGGLNDLYVSRLTVPSGPGTGPRRIRTLRVWIESVDAGDQPRAMIYRDTADAPDELAYDFGQIDTTTVVAPGWADLHVPPDELITFDGGDILYLAIKSEANATVLRFMGAGSGFAGDWDGAFQLRATDGSMSGDATVPAEAAWVGGLGAPIAVLFPAQIIWADTDAQVGDASIVRRWGSPRSAPIGDFPNRTVLPGSIVHMVAPALSLLGVRLGERHLGVGSHTSTGSMRCEFWEGDAALLDPTFPHNPDSDGLAVVHDYGTETELTPEAWNDLAAPAEPVYLSSTGAWALSVHSDGTDTTEIAFELTGTGLATTMNSRLEAYDWYPVDGLGAGSGSEVEAYDPSVSVPPREGDGNDTIVIDPDLPAVTPHTQHVSDIWQGNCPALGVTLYVDGMGPV